MNKLILLISLTLFLASCQASPASQPTVTLDPPNPNATLQGFSNDYQAGNPVENASQAQVVALKALNKNFTYLEPLLVAKVEKMSYVESKQLMDQPLNQVADVEIWMILYFNDEWKANLPDLNGTPLPILPGCVYMAIKADNGSLLEVGGPLDLINAFPECDQ